jgi:hypothetical protein
MPCYYPTRCDCNCVLCLSGAHTCREGRLTRRYYLTESIRASEDEEIFRILDNIAADGFIPGPEPERFNLRTLEWAICSHCKRVCCEEAFTERAINRAIQLVGISEGDDLRHLVQRLQHAESTIQDRAPFAGPLEEEVRSLWIYLASRPNVLLTRPASPSGRRSRFDRDIEQ